MALLAPQVSEFISRLIGRLREIQVPGGQTLSFGPDVDQAEGALRSASEEEGKREVKASFEQRLKTLCREPITTQVVSLPLISVGTSSSAIAERNPVLAMVSLRGELENKAAQLCTKIPSVARAVITSPVPYRELTSYSEELLRNELISPALFNSLNQISELANLASHAGSIPLDEAKRVINSGQEVARILDIKLGQVEDIQKGMH